MPSPLAHVVTGYAIARCRKENFSRQWWFVSLYAAFVAIAPDFDFVLQLLTGDRYHRGASHSLLSCLSFSAVAGLVSYAFNRRQTIGWFGLTLVVYGSHLLLDCVTQSTTGVQLLWPLPDYYQSPVPLFPSVRHWEGWRHHSHLIFLSVESLYAILLLIGMNQWLSRSGVGRASRK